MNPNSEKFRDYAVSQLNSSSFATSHEDDQTQLFHTSVDSTFHLLKWTHESRNCAGEPFSFYPGFVNIFSPNAFADRHEGNYFFGLHAALFVSVSEFAMFCFAQADFFPEMGDATKESSPSPWDHRVPGLWLIDHTGSGGHVEERHSGKLIPTDPERFHFSNCLAFLMARTVWMHELSHCFNGHVDLVHERDIALRLYEVSPLPIAGRRSCNGWVFTRSCG